MIFSKACEQIENREVIFAEAIIQPAYAKPLYSQVFRFSFNCGVSVYFFQHLFFVVMFCQVLIFLVNDYFINSYLYNVNIIISYEFNVEIIDTLRLISFPQNHRHTLTYRIFILRQPSLCQNYLYLLKTNSKHPPHRFYFLLDASMALILTEILYGILR